MVLSHRSECAVILLSVFEESFEGCILEHVYFLWFEWIRIKCKIVKCQGLAAWGLERDACISDHDCIWSRTYRSSWMFSQLLGFIWTRKDAKFEQSRNFRFENIKVSELRLQEDYPKQRWAFSRCILPLRRRNKNSFERFPPVFLTSQRCCSTLVCLRFNPFVTRFAVHELPAPQKTWRK